MKIFTYLLAIVVLLNSANIFGQTTSSFDDLSLPADSFWNGADGSGGFNSGNAFFVNDYNASWQSWSGFSYSTKTDSITAGYTNEFSSITGSGYLSSAYAVAFVSSYGGPTFIGLRNLAKGKSVNGFRICNSTYSYLSMRDGDAVAKKFGGVTGNDPDWFRLTVDGYQEGVFTDSVDFYLADFRFSDNSQDYILKTWEWVDLTNLGPVDSLVFRFSSSDIGSWGMNTPSYFCMDDFTTSDGVGIQQATMDIKMAIYPNPATDFIQIESSDPINQIQIFDQTGRLIRALVIENELFTKVNLKEIPSGIYFLKVVTNKGYQMQKLVIE
ncbi:MAG: DUF4465 domain-containing protein [Bacteroidales bacterium]|nr:DUF4465 domain-containing protein [Bacteroidales bacterium]